MAKAGSSASVGATATIIRRPTQNALRAQRAAERKAYDESFSYEDDKRAAASSAQSTAETKASAKRR